MGSRGRRFETCHRDHFRRALGCDRSSTAERRNVTPPMPVRFRPVTPKRMLHTTARPLVAELAYAPVSEAGPQGMAVPPGRPKVLTRPLRGQRTPRALGGYASSSTRTEGTTLIAWDRAQRRSRDKSFRRETRQLTGQGSTALPVCGGRVQPRRRCTCRCRGKRRNQVKRWTPARVGVRFPASPPLDSSIGRATH